MHRAYRADEAKMHLPKAKDGEEKMLMEEAQQVPLWYKGCSLTALVATSTATVLMLRYSRTMATTGPLYLSSSAVAVSEVVKVILSFAAIFISCGCSSSAMMKLLQVEMLVKVKEMAKMTVPAFLYVVQNNLLFLALSNLDAATYQVTYQCKILTTALLSVLMLGKRLDRLKWFSLVVLMVGVIIVQFPSKNASVAEKHDFASQVIGLTAVFIACLTSGFAGVYLELVLKTTRTSLWVRNLQLALFSVVAAFVTMFAQDGAAVMSDGMFQGYIWITWIVIMLQAGGGLVIALVVKFADNILKVFATSISIVCSCILSCVILDDFKPSFSFVVGAMLVIGSTVLYGYERDQSVRPPRPATAK
uniref:Sugar phosphate transporter domain-containing protein n=1 Tax=Trichuris muris TaxID=70415 RepID=A0A5S6Q9T1_TRIMR